VGKKRVFVQVQVLVTGAGPKAVKALELEGDVEGKPQAAMVQLQKELTRLGLKVSCQLTKKKVITCQVSARQWNVSGVRQRAEQIVNSLFVLSGVGILGSLNS
jgi:hypothetical protein